MIERQESGYIELNQENEPGCDASSPSRDRGDPLTNDGTN